MRLRAIFLIFVLACFALVDAEAQSIGKPPRVGFLVMGRHPSATVFAQGLRDLGWVDGQNVVIEYRFAEVGKPEQFPALAAELVSLKVDVIVALLNPEIAAARLATSTIPIVMIIGVDPVGQGFVRSLARPGTNVTGLAWDPTPEVYGKMIELVKEALPTMSRIGTIVDTKFPGLVPYLASLDEAARRLNVGLVRAEVREPGDIDNAFISMTQQHVGAGIVAGGTTLFSNRARLAGLAKQRKLPLVFPYREGVDAGGLLSYGPSLPELWRRSAAYVDRVLKGAKPADLPVEQPTKFELVINLKTAKALGVTIPPSLLLRADQVIE
jgi:ABC-type uncharacterized transport system substrate-binding protein